MRMPQEDLQFLLDEARRRYIEMPAGAHLYAGKRPLSEGERIALSFFTAAATIFYRHGFIPGEKIGAVDPELEHGSSETPTQGLE